MALEIPLAKSNLRQKRISFMGPSISNKLSNALKMLNTATSFTHNYKKLVLKKLELVEHYFNHNFNTIIITILTLLLSLLLLILLLLLL